MKFDVNAVDFKKGSGLVPALVQDSKTRRILMLAYMNEEALRKTLESGYAHYWSRGRGRLWLKGETSGHVQKVRGIRLDCDLDAVLLQVSQKGVPCHLGEETCFHNEIEHGLFLEKRWNERIVTEILEHLKGSKIFKVKEDAGEDSIHVVNALTELLPPPSPEWMEWLASIIDAMSSHPIDKVVTTEGPGVYLASLVASRRGKSLAVASRRPIPETEETEFTAGCFEGQGDGTHYIYGVYMNERVLLVENNISTGKALASMLESLQGLDVKLKEVICLIGRPDHKGKEVIKQDTGVNVKTLFDLSVKEGRIDVGISPEMSDYFQSLI